MKPEFVNIAAYKFVDLDDLSELKSSLLPFCKSLGLKGTILLSLEGINLFLAGTRDAIDQFLSHIRSIDGLEELAVKESLSDQQPFSRMLVRLKKEIISMGVDQIRPLQKTSPKISATQLKRWLDEGKDLTLLDVRNDYEVEVGTFRGAVPIEIDHFRRFPEATKKLPTEMKQRPLVMFCTGGIRCEKAGPLMEQEGFEQVYQLDGGILKYFEDCGGEHYDGDCFVFDKRVAVDPQLNETEHGLCYACQMVLSAEDQQSEHYDPPHSCPHCFQTPEEQLQELLQSRNERLKLITTPLPGCVAYNNVRPMNVPLRLDRQPVIDFLLGMHAHVSREAWEESCRQGRVTYKGEPLSGDQVVRAGWRIEHHVPQTTEPAVSNDLTFIYEDDVLIAINKPAPLPMHPCGRFNLNTVDHFVNQVYAGEQIRILHRLDSNTTGVVVMARKKSAANFVHPQFLNGEVDKTYLARVVGHPQQDQLLCDAAISNTTSSVGSRKIEETGRDAKTEFEVLTRYDDGTTLVSCHPKTGRTNQIRIHLSHLGFPIQGDPTYGKSEPATRQTLSVDDPPMCLHAWKLELTHPISKQRFELEAGRPDWCQ